MRKTAVWPPWSIFSNGGHVFFPITMKWGIFVANLPRIIAIKFEVNLFSGFRGEDFWKSLYTTTDDDGRRTHNHGISSHDHRSGELTRWYVYKTWNVPIVCITILNTRCVSIVRFGPYFYCTLLYYSNQPTHINPIPCLVHEKRII